MVRKSGYFAGEHPLKFEVSFIAVLRPMLLVYMPNKLDKRLVCVQLKTNKN